MHETRDLDLAHVLADRGYDVTLRVPDRAELDLRNGFSRLSVERWGGDDASSDVAPRSDTFVWVVEVQLWPVWAWPWKRGLCAWPWQKDAIVWSTHGTEAAAREAVRRHGLSRYRKVQVYGSNVQTPATRAQDRDNAARLGGPALVPNQS